MIGLMSKMSDALFGLRLLSMVVTISMVVGFSVNGGGSGSSGGIGVGGEDGKLNKHRD